MSFYFKQHKEIKHLTTISKLTKQCRQEISSEIETTPGCLKFRGLLPESEFIKMTHETLQTELNEYFSGYEDEGMKSLKREIVKEQFNVFEQSLNEVESELKDPLAYTESLLLLFNLAVVLFYLYFTWRYFRAKKTARRKLPKIKALLLYLLEKHFLEMVPYYKDISVPEKGETLISDDFLGSVFFSLLKINEAIKNEYQPLGKIELRVEQSSSFIRIIQILNFMNDDTDISSFIKEEMNYKILLGLIEEQNGHIKLDKDEQSAREFLEIYLQVESGAARH